MQCVEHDATDAMAGKERCKFRVHPAAKGR